MTMTKLQLTVNGQDTGPHQVPDYLPMVDFLHEYLGLTGTKFSCGIGICHACVVIVDEEDGSSRTMRTCINGATEFNGKAVRTVEGHAGNGQLSPVQKAFVDHFSFQCGFCTSGFVNETTRFLEDLAKAPIPQNQIEAKIEEALGEHICRCSGYVRYYEAVRDLIRADPRYTKAG